MIIQRVIMPAMMMTASLFCAGQIAPSGGPPDTTPPEILSSYPEPRTINFRDHKLALSFSKYVDRRSVEESIFVSPSLGPLTFDWGSTDVEISFADSLRPDATYILTLGTDLRDTRNNHLTKSFSLPFSAGDRIDSCSLGGSVDDKERGGVMIFGYLLNGRNPDTLSPARAKPDYITQTGKDGSFTLPYLAFGTYRILAVRDEYKNLLYDPEKDFYGIFGPDITLAPGKAALTGFQCRLASEDTSAPFISSARALDRSHVLLKFNEAIDARSVGGVEIRDTASGSPLGILDLSFAEPPALEATLVTAEQKASAPYRLTVGRARDLSGNLIRSPQNTGDFSGIPDPDTSRPQFTLSAGRSIPLDDTFHIKFSEPVVKESFERGFSLRPDSAPGRIQGKFVWWFSRAVSFVPERLLAAGSDYRITIRPDSVIDFSGNHGRDSLAVIRFHTVDEGSLSSLSGDIADESTTDARGRFFVTARNLAESESRTIILGGAGKFAFSDLKEGRYVLTAFRDRDGNGAYSYGKPFPFMTAERFLVYPDTLTLRARWPLEGVSLHLR